MQITPELSTLSILTIGFVLGLRHATEADHLAAVSTIVSEKKNVFTASIVGALWGVGHTVSLFIVVLLVIFLRIEISGSAENKLEGVVGIMLAVLGINALIKLLRSDKVHIHTHEHDGHAHMHIHSHSTEDKEVSHHRLSPRSVVIGIVHGLAGSAALMLLVVPTIHSPAVALLYILIFGVGSIGGMMLMSLLMGLPFHLTATRFRWLNKGIRLCAGVFSLGLGLSIVYERFISS